jgi:hypothetical protein
VISSNTSSVISRSRKPIVITVSAPISRPPVAIATRWLLIRLSSIRSTRITVAFSGIWSSIPSNFSIARQYAAS